MSHIRQVDQVAITVAVLDTGIGLPDSATQIVTAR